MSTIIWAFAAFAIATQSTGQKPVEYPFKQIEQGGFSRLRTPQVFVIKSADDYQAYNKTCGREVATPMIDWTQNQLLAIHIGPAPTTGYAAVVKRIVKTGPNTVDVEVTKTIPAPRHMVAMHVTYPWAIVRTTRFTESVKLKVLPADKPAGQQ